MGMLDLDVDLMDFDIEDLPTTTKVQPVIVEKVTLRPSRTETAHVAVPTSQWNWSDLRDYIITEVEKRHGPQVRDAMKEASVIKSFITRWGIDQAVAIAKAAFDVHDGMWRNAPISINRFCKGSDDYFAGVIAQNL